MPAFGKLAAVLGTAFLIGGLGGGSLAAGLTASQTAPLVLTTEEKATVDKILPLVPDHFHSVTTKVAWRDEDARHRDSGVTLVGTDDKGGVRYVVLIITDKSDGSTTYGADVFRA